MAARCLSFAAFALVLALFVVSGTDALPFKYQKPLRQQQPAEVIAAPVSTTGLSNTFHIPDFLVPVEMNHVSVSQEGELDLKLPKRCGSCESFASQMVGQLEKILAQTVVGGGCAALCSLLPELAQLCMLGCEVVGYKEFINILQEVQGFIDPVFFCSKVHLCKETEGGVITDGALNLPKSVQAGQPFVIEADFKVGKPLGAGEIIIMLQPPHGGAPLGGGNFEDGFKAGNASLKVNVRLADPQPNPKQPGPPPPPLPRGQWIAKIMICQLMCGSPYKEAALYKTFAAPFELANTTSTTH